MRSETSLKDLFAAILWAVNFPIVQLLLRNCDKGTGQPIYLCECLVGYSLNTINSITQGSSM